MKNFYALQNLAIFKGKSNKSQSTTDVQRSQKVSVIKLIDWRISHTCIFHQKTNCTLDNKIIWTNLGSILSSKREKSFYYEMIVNRLSSTRLLSVIVWVSVVLKRTVVDINLHFNNMSRNHLQSDVNCKSSVDGIYVWLLLSLVSLAMVLLAVIGSG